MKLVVFASGEGSNFEVLARHHEVVLLVCDNPEAKVLARATSFKTKTFVLNPKDFADKQTAETKILSELKKYDFDLICLAGWMRILSAQFLKNFAKNSILNLHPSLLPKYPGKRGYEDSFNSGDAVCGLTYHFVDAGVDTGPILHQVQFLRTPNESFAEFKSKGKELEGPGFLYALTIIENKNFVAEFVVQNEITEEQRVLWVQHKGPWASLALTFNEYFVDRVIEKLHIDQQLQVLETRYYEKGFHPGVTDNPAQVAHMVLAQNTFGQREFQCRSGMRSTKPMHFNSLLEWQAVKPHEYPKWITPQPDREIRFFNLNISDQELLQLSNENWWALNLSELRVIRDHFSNLGRAPSDVEIEMIAQTWSEHCKHKIFRAEIEYENNQGLIEKYSLFQDFIKGTTDQIAHPELVSVFDDNAGIVHMNQEWDVAIKVETHNSPSALDPYGGALTGVLGVNRDIMGVGLGAAPVANFDVLCFAPENLPKSVAQTSDPHWPTGLLAPKNIEAGVLKGVQDAGNKSGIPNIGGAIYYHPHFAGKPYVFCGTIGLQPRGQDFHLKNPAAGDHVVMVGGRVGKDGLHGATFSSMELKNETPNSVVQIGDPFTQKKMLDFLLKARDQKLFSAITDNGAGGLSSSVGEMSQLTGGAFIHLDRVPLKYSGLAPWEIWVSESQERMTLAVPEKNLNQFMAMAQIYDVEATCIGHFTETGKIQAEFQGEVVLDLDLHFLHHGCPQMKLRAIGSHSHRWQNWLPSSKKQLPQFNPKYFSEVLGHLQAQDFFKSPEGRIRRFDHEVQGRNARKFFSFEGAPQSGSAVMLNESEAVSLGLGLCPLMSTLDPYEMGRAAVDEAMRNSICAGADPSKIYMCDNFAWPDPIHSDQNPLGAWKLGLLIETCKGMKDLLMAFKTPLVSGKDSMKNEAMITRDQKKFQLSSLPTLLMTAVGFIPEIPRDHFSENQIIALVELPQTGPSLHASQFFEMDEGLCQFPKSHELAEFYKQIFKVRKKLKWIEDISEGGLLITLSEQSKRIGLDIEIENSHMRNWNFWLREGLGRFLVAVDSVNELNGINHFVLGRTSRNKGLRIDGVEI